MKKIGSVEKQKTTYSPSEEDLKAFRSQRMAELRELYSNRKNSQIPFNCELDEIVLDCWKPN